MAFAATITVATAEKLNGVFWQSIPRGHKREDLFDRVQFVNRLLP
jgi:hypothetical protein